MFNGAMTPQKRHRDEDLEDDIVLCIEVEKTNQQDHVEVACTTAYDTENPRISRRVIRAVRKELIRMINEQKEYGADITEFEHILHRDDEPGFQKKKNNGVTLYDKSNGRIYTQNGRPQVRCPAKGLRVIPRLNYADRYSNRTGKPLNKSEARYEELIFRSPSIKKTKTEGKESEKEIERESEKESVVDQDVEDDMEEYVGEQMDESVNGYVANQGEEEFEDSVFGRNEDDSGTHVEEDEKETMGEEAEAAISLMLSQSLVNHYMRQQQDPVEDSAIADTTTPIEELD